AVVRQIESIYRCIRQPTCRVSLQQPPMETGMRRLPISSAGLLLLLCPLLAPAQTVQRQEGRAFAEDGGALLYRETHWLQGPPEALSRLVLYRCADGRAFAR